MKKICPEAELNIPVWEKITTLFEKRDLYQLDFSCESLKKACRLVVEDCQNLKVGGGSDIRDLIKAASVINEARFGLCSFFLLFPFSFFGFSIFTLSRDFIMLY